MNDRYYAPPDEKESTLISNKRNRDYHIYLDLNKDTNK